jgi:hypothetical protein
MNDLRDWLESELDAEGPAPAPAPDLVGGALRRGRRMLRVRRLGVTAGVVVIAFTVGLAGWFAPWRTDAVPRPAQPSPAVTEPANAATIAFELEQRLPAGVHLVAAYQYERNPPGAAVYLDRGTGVGLVQVTVDSYPATAEVCQSNSCSRDADGATTAIGTGAAAATSAGCLETTRVQRFRPDGVHVSVFLATCLMWDGQGYPPGRTVLTVEEAAAIAADPHWGTSMDARLVAAAAQRFPSLPPWAHP